MNQHSRAERDRSCAKANLSDRVAEDALTASEGPLVVFSALGTLGDVNPMIAVAKEFRTRGYRTILVSNEQFENEARRAQLPFLSVGPSAEYRAAYTGEIWNRKSDHGVRTHFLDYHFPARLRGFARIQTLFAEHADVVVVSLGAQDGPALAAQKLGLPLVQVVVTPTDAAVVTPETVCFHELHLSRLRWGRYRIHLKRFRNRVHLLKRTLGPAVNTLRVAFGLPRISLWRQGTNPVQLSLSMLPDWYLAVANANAPLAIPVGFPLSDSVDSGSRRVVDEFLERQGRPLVFTPGTGVKDVKAFLLLALEVSKNLDIPCILLSKEWRQVSEFMTERTLGCDYVDLAYVLPRAAALIHHGGIGTCAQAIRAGIPQLIRPLQFDQFENGYRVWKLGVGAYIFAESCTAAKCTALLRAMLAKAPTMKGLQEYSRRLSGVSGAVVAADHIERFLDTRRSIATSRLDGPRGARNPEGLASGRDRTEVERLATSPPLFSVVVIIRPSTRDPGRALLSVAEQDFTQFEAVALGSAVECQKLEIEGCSAAQLRIASDVSTRREDWLQELRGEWLVILEGDDEWMPNFLRQHHERILEAPETVGSIGCNGCEVDHDESGHIVACRRCSFLPARRGLLRVFDQFRRRSRPVGVCVRRKLVTCSKRATAALQRGDVQALLRELSKYDSISGENAGVLCHRYVDARSSKPVARDAPLLRRLVISCMEGGS